MPEGFDVQYDPVRIRYSLGQALLGQGRPREAVPYLSQAVARDPNHAEAHYALAVALAELKEPALSAMHFIAAMRLQPSVDTSPTLHHLLAGFYMEQRAFGEALAHEDRALVLAQGLGDRAFIRAIEERRTLCRKLVESTQATR
jgi:tetratricopeptide (TPR) repeat protein